MQFSLVSLFDTVFNYCEQNKERDEKRELDHQRRWNEALEWELYNTFLERADNYGYGD